MIVEPARIGANGSIQPRRSLRRAPGSLVQPPVVGGQVELADAARRSAVRCLIAISHSLSQVRADLARLREQLRVDGVDLPEQVVERVLVDLRVLAQRRQHLLLPLELLQEVGLQVRARGDVRDLEQREQRAVVVLRRVLRREVAGPRE